jgi:hypothetical protein
MDEMTEQDLLYTIQLNKNRLKEWEEISIKIKDLASDVRLSLTEISLFEMSNRFEGTIERNIKYAREKLCTLRNE